MKKKKSLKKPKPIVKATSVRHAECGCIGCIPNKPIIVTFNF